MFKVFRSDDGLVSKYTHGDESETSIKVVPSKDTTLDAKVRINDRGKYTVFISSSKGCYLSCGFCDLTISKVPYRKLDMGSVLSNLKESLLEKVKFNPDIKKRYIKLSWMGMGDALSNPEMVYEVSIAYLKWVMDNNLAAGLDSVDLSTSFAKVGGNWVNVFSDLNKELIHLGYPTNPNTVDGRSPFRLFYSLQSPSDEVRKVLVPRTESILKALSALRRARDEGIRVVFHYVVLDGINDTSEQANYLVKLLKDNDFQDEEIRFLRYNAHPESTFVESARRFEFAKTVSTKHPNIKLQISEGKEVRSACGQFMWGQ